MWNNESAYTNPKPNANTHHGAKSSLRVQTTHSGSSRSPTTPVTTNSLNPIQFNPTTLGGNSGSSPRTSPPGTSGSSFVSGKTGHKRKRVKKNEPAQWAGGESDSDSEDDELAGGISVGMGGLGVIGKGVGPKGSRL